MSGCCTRAPREVCGESLDGVPGYIESGKLPEPITCVWVPGTISGLLDAAGNAGRPGPPLFPGSLPAPEALGPYS
jgi:hypothetical protein